MVNNRLFTDYHLSITLCKNCSNGLRLRMETLRLAKYKNKLSDLCSTYNVKRLELFGSASRGEFDVEKSDIDFLVEFNDTHSLGAFDRYFGLKEDLEQLFQCPVDLVEAQAIRNPYFKQAVEQDKVLVYAI